jgi:L-ascorbate metabolism protein UlaG (beta-lactamase superfamily)
MLVGKARSRWPKFSEGLTHDKPPERVSNLRLSSAGHSSILVQISGLNLLFDPVWSNRVSPFALAGPRRAHPPAIRFEDLPPIDAILVTHNHYDHLDGETIARLCQRFGPRVIVPLGNKCIVDRYASGLVQAEEFDWGDGVTLSDHITAHLEPAFHWSGRGIRDRRMALWCSFVLTSSRGGVLYHVGDTAYGDGSFFRAIKSIYGAPQVALIPIGAYEPRWFMEAQHVNPAEAVQIMRDCGAWRAFGHHWGTFQLTHENADAPAVALRDALISRNIPLEKFVPLRPGEAHEVAWT